MDPKTVSMRSLPEGASGVSAGTVDMIDALLDIQKKRREGEELNAKQKELELEVESLNQRINVVQKQIKDSNKLNKKLRLECKDKANRAFEKVERKKKEIFQAESEKLEKEKVEQLERNREIERQVQEHSVYQEIMEQLVKRTQFQDVESLADHLEKNLQFREQLTQRDREAQEQINHLRQQLVAGENQHHLLLLQKQKQLSQLLTELQEARSEAQIWERKWNHIQETTEKKTLLLVRIKMATLNIYEMISGYFEGEGPVDMNDTEKQLDKIQIFIQDHEDILKQYQTLQRSSDEQKRERTKE